MLMLVHRYGGSARRPRSGKRFDCGPPWAGTRRTSRAATLAAVAILSMLPTIVLAPAGAQEPYRIVALGASNTAGRGVGARAAWPAQLEALLHARGYRMQVINAGISGDDTSGMLARLDQAIPEGTRLVLLDKTDTNDRRRGIDTARNVTAIVAHLKARNIRTIVLPSLHALSGGRLQGDGIHITADGHATIAARLASRVAQAIGRRGKR